MIMRVTWTIDLAADTPREAALQALKYHRNPDATALVYEVKDENGTKTTVDLWERPTR